MLRRDQLLLLSDFEYARKLLEWWGVWLHQSGDMSGMRGSLVSGAYSNIGAGRGEFTPVAARDPYAERVDALMREMRGDDEMSRQYLALVFTYDKQLSVVEAARRLGGVSDKQFRIYRREGMIYMAGRLAETRARRLAS